MTEGNYFGLSEDPWKGIAPNGSFCVEHRQPITRHHVMCDMCTVTKKRDAKLEQLYWELLRKV